MVQIKCKVRNDDELLVFEAMNLHDLHGGLVIAILVHTEQVHIYNVLST